MTVRDIHRQESIKISLLQIDLDLEVFCLQPLGFLTPAVDLAVTADWCSLWPFSFAGSVFLSCLCVSVNLFPSPSSFVFL